MSRHWAGSYLACLGLAWCALTVPGGRHCLASNCFKIDPTGQHLFVPCDKPVEVPGNSCCNRRVSLGLVPGKVIAPIGSEVVLLAAVCGQDGYLLANERVEWMLAPGGVGQFIEVGDHKSGLSYDTFIRRHPGAQEWYRKVDNTYAIGSTSSKYLLLTRGTPTRDDDISVLKGQAWLTVSSPIEGTSHVTAFAPSVPGWDSRKQTATVYWIDAQAAFPPPAINPVGSRHVFTTTVTRCTNQAPLSGWRVRYEITGGPPAGFLPDNAQIVEVSTNSLGQANAEIVQAQPAAGTNTISIQVIRTENLPGNDGTRLVVQSGTTNKTWTSSAISLDKSGPKEAALGGVVSFRLDIRNPGELTAKEVVLVDQIPPGLTFLNSNPPAATNGARLEWRLGDLRGGENRMVEVTCRADAPGTVQNCATVQTADGVSAQDCVTTTIIPSAIDVTVIGPAQAVVGQTVNFEVTVTNRGGTAASGLTIIDRFDSGLQHASGANPIERDLEPPLGPGESRRINVPLRVVQPGQQCNTVEIVGDGGMKSSARACVTATLAAGAVPPATVPPSNTGPTPATPRTAPPAAPPATAPPGEAPTLSIRKTGPTKRQVGEVAEFVIDITNTSRFQATGLKLVDHYSINLDPVQATPGFSFLNDDMIWYVDELPAGKTIRFEVRCKCLAPEKESCNEVTVTSKEGSRADSRACLEIQAVAGALTLTVGDLRDPVAVGNDTTYDISVTNGAAVSDRMVAVIVTLPPEMQPIQQGTGGQPSKIEGQTIRFEPIRELRAGEKVAIRVQARALRAADIKVQVSASSQGNPRAVTAEETTRIFSGQ